MTVAERGPPPRGQSGRVGRQRREGAGWTTRPCPKGARAVQASTGGPAGVRPQGRKGDDGSHTASTPPICRETSAAPRACTVLATCIRQRTGSEDAPPPPPPSPPPSQERGEDSEETARGHGDGQRTDRNAGGRDEWRAVEVQKKKKGHQRARAGTDSRGRRDTAGARKHGKGRGKGGHPWGRKLGGRDQHRSERGGGRGDKSPQKTLVRYATSGVLGATPVSVSAPPERRQ